MRTQHFYTGDSFDLSRIYRQSLRNEQVVNTCTRAPFPRLGKYPQVTNVRPIEQTWKRGFEMRSLLMDSPDAVSDTDLS